MKPGALVVMMALALSGCAPPEPEPAEMDAHAEADLLAYTEDTRNWKIFADEAVRRDRTDRFV